MEDLDSAALERDDLEVESLPTQVLLPPPPLPPAPPTTGGDDDGEAFVPGDRVMVADGPFEGFEGKVVEVDRDRRTLRVIVKIFGGGSPAELHVSHVRRI
ncbi:MAG: transcription termination/antitermination protein NusG [Acidimicrobiaceae bacterium]|nr:transcription termination/antitermination protein NusG [Acidimicrobiaceae bacterium]